MFGTVRTLNVDLRFENLVSEKECKAQIITSLNDSMKEILSSLRIINNGNLSKKSFEFMNNFFDFFECITT